MQKSLLLLLVSALFLSTAVPYTESAPTPLPPDAGKLALAPVPKTIVEPVQVPDYPERLIIPSIKLNSVVDALGINSKGEMEVPDGSSSHVGWYKDGTIPGQMGSAVMDAHVYAAFNKLRYVKIGSDIYVQTTTGKKLHFKVQDSRVYKLNELSPDLLFNRADGKRLNLITCAGTYQKRLGTYDHRLVVYATLVEE